MSSLCLCLRVALFFKMELSSVLCVLLEGIFRMEDNGVLQASVFRVVILAGLVWSQFQSIRESLCKLKSVEGVLSL